MEGRSTAGSPLFGLGHFCGRPRHPQVGTFPEQVVSTRRLEVDTRSPKVLCGGTPFFMTKKAIDKKGQAGPSAEKARLNSDSRVGLLGLILSDRKFVAALVGGVAVIGAMAVSLPKVWVITPKNFVPVIRISLLDMVQARMLGKSARKLGAEGRRKEAVIAWAGALGNHPAHRENLRGFVEYTLTEEGLEHRWLMIGAQQAQWLATLSGTNDASNVELAGRMLTRAGFDEQAWGFLQTTNRSLSLPAARALAEVAFKTGRLKEFVDVWERYQADLERDPGLTLYRSAWMAVAGPPGEQAASMAAIEAATKSPVLAVTAFRLRSMVEAMRLDVDGFQRSFEELRALRVDMLDDHIRSWLVLDAAGEHALAVAKATAYAVPPETVSQARQMLVAWTRLRLENLAVGFARNQLDEIGRAHV